MRHANSIANAETVVTGRIPITCHVNGKRGHCVNHGKETQVMTVKTGYFEKGEIEICSRCKSVIQGKPVPPKTPTHDLTPSEKAVLDLLASRIGRIIPYKDFESVGCMERADIFVRVSAIRRKVQGVKIRTQNNSGYIMDYWNKNQPRADEYRWYCEMGHEWPEGTDFDEVFTERGLKPACPTCGKEVWQAEVR